MDRTSISRRIGSIKGDIEKLSNTLCAIEKTDIENYPDNYAMLTTDAALRSELIACRMRHLLYGSTATRKETYLASAGVVQGIRIKAQENMLEITLPCLLPKRKQRQSTEFLIDPLYFTLSQYSDNNELPKFRQCVVCFSHIYEGRTVQARVIAVAEKAVRASKPSVWNAQSWHGTCPGIGSGMPMTAFPSGIRFSSVFWRSTEIAWRSFPSVQM